MIKASGIYHPKNKVNNDFFIEHYEKKEVGLGEKVSHLLEKTGRRSRFLAEPMETTLTMAQAAVVAAVQSAKIDISEIDGIIFCSETPEYFVPSNACWLKHNLNAVNAHMVYDLNGNCAGMLPAIDQVCALMRTNRRIQKAVVVGATLLQRLSEESNPITFANLGDAACAVVLESIDTEQNKTELGHGFLDSLYETDTDLIASIVYPLGGITPNTDIPDDEKIFNWLPFKTKRLELCCAGLIQRILRDNGYTTKQVKRVFFTQFSKETRNGVVSRTGIALDKFAFVGDIYGYTGVSSPFLAYHHSSNDNELAKGDIVIFCSAGAGIMAAALLYKV